MIEERPVKSNIDHTIRKHEAAMALSINLSKVETQRPEIDWRYQLKVMQQAIKWIAIFRFS